MTDPLVIPLSTRNSAVSFAIRFGGVSDVRGVFDELEGTLRIPDCCVERAQVELRVAAASVNTGIGLRDHHLRGPGFLDAEQWPWIVFASDDVSREDTALRVGGTLSLRGIVVPVTVRAPFEFARGNGMSALVSFHTEFPITRQAHGIGTGGWRRLNPLNLAIAPVVRVRAELLVPASQLLPALLPALGR
jgi:polyisoprenoid-binding protein YceI